MPLYEFHCRQCQRDQEILIRGSEVPECPECGSQRLEKLLSVPAAPANGATSSLPMCKPSPNGGCGLPPCGMGGCHLE